MKSRRGSALIWALVIIAMFTAFITAMLPVVANANDLDEVSIAATQLRTTANAIRSFSATVFRTTATGAPFTPNRLNQLTNPVTLNGQAGCSFGGTNDQYNTTAVNGWTASGPYGPYFMTTTGLSTPLGTLNDTPSAAYNTIGTTRTAISDPYFIQIQNVDVKLARLMDLYVDHTAGNAADTVYYTLPVASDSTVTLSWRVYPAAGTTPC